MSTGRSINRRQLVKFGTTAAVGLIIARSTSAEGIALSESDPTALALGYAEDADEVDTTRWTKKAGPDGETQKCSTCALYQAQDEVWGGCSIFPGKKVKGAGWCNAWISG